MQYGLYCGCERYSGYENPFGGQGAWYKGNLHTHTTRSDGSLTLEKTTEFYSRSGYDFICVSDHHVFTDTPELSAPGLLVLPGVELDVAKKKALDREGRPEGIGYHCNALTLDFDGEGGFEHDYLEEYRDIEDGMPIKEAVSRVNERYVRRGCMVILNHPCWSRQSCADAFGIRGVFAMEIYNHACETGSKTGLSTAHWDYCLRHGQRLYGVAADDTHFRQPGFPRGHIMVRAGELSRRSITQAIRGGHFYSSTGPEIYEFYLEGHTIVLKCSPVKTVRFIKYEPMGASFHAEKGGYLTGAETGVTGNENYVRAEIVDENGFAAWTNPIFMHGGEE